MCLCFVVALGPEGLEFKVWFRAFVGGFALGGFRVAYYG